MSYDPADPNSEDQTLPQAPPVQAPPREPPVLSAPDPATPSPGTPAEQQPTGQAPIEAVRLTDEQALKVPAKQFDIFRNPEVLTRIAEGYLERGSKTGIAWLAHASHAVTGNAVEAAQALVRNDPKGALDAYNRNGEHTDATDAKKNSDGTWTIAHKSGQQTIIDPNQEMASLLSPEAYLTNERHKAELNQKAKLNDAQIGNLKAQGRYHDAQARELDARPETREYVARLNAGAKLEHERMAGLIAQGKLDASTALKTYEAKYGPQTMYLDLLKLSKDDASMTNEQKNVAAVRQVIEHSQSGITPVMSAPGQVTLMNNATREPWGQPRSAAEFAKNFPGIAIKMPPEKPGDPNVPAAATQPTGKFVPPADPGGPPSPNVPPTGMNAPDVPNAAAMANSVREYEAAAAERAKAAQAAKQSPRYADLLAQRRDAIRANDSNRITAIDKEIKLLLSNTGTSKIK